MPPLVSIITPSYNQAEYLEFTLRSVLRQDYPRIEYLVVDGDSTDGSPAIIQKYADQLAWWVSERDNGQAEAINKGFSRASGEIVAWLNSDDLYLPGAIRLAVETLQAHPEVGLVYGDAISIDRRGRPINRQIFGDLDLVDFLSFRIICQPAVFMRRSAAEQAGYLDPSFHFMLDHHLWIRVAQIAPPAHLPALLAAARQHPQAKNVRQAGGFSQEINAILEWIQAQPDLADLYRDNQNKIEGGAFRLQARYSLDAGRLSEARKYYGLALRASPGYALKHWRRMLYAALGPLMPTKPDREFFSQRKRARALAAASDLQEWPGITLE